MHILFFREVFIENFEIEHKTCQFLVRAGGATRMARGGIRLVHGLTKSTLITYFSGMKKDPKYAFLHAFFLICLSCSFQNLSIWPKTYPFFQYFARFCTPKRCTRVQCLVLKNNPNYVNFLTSLIPPLDIRVAPLGVRGVLPLKYFTKQEATLHYHKLQNLRYRTQLSKDVKLKYCVRYKCNIFP